MSDPIWNAFGREIRQALAELELVSHAPVQGFGRIHDSTDSKGGRRPPGSDAEFRPRKPPIPFREGDAASEKAWQEYDEDLAAWEACYQRRTVSHYRDQLRRRGPSQALLADIGRTIRAWRVMQIPPGQPPALGDPLWKRYIAESREDPGVLATRFSVTRRYINMIRRKYREEAA